MCALFVWLHSFAWYQGSSYVGTLSIWTQDESRLQGLPTREFCMLSFPTSKKSQWFDIDINITDILVCTKLICDH